ncbi:hypothetical protein PV08_06253 [Exophiala spinifera]|uniref:Uncharacterized protein n=1 Tax=Exophiala spinifera TaxID=91928 RepID=A0A0D1ZTT8_9EURO|nr:uncharacterized protein PV08_06253 [Exophiala spinifera]KIW16202.1 hypothetical protein PV08_06253 [Exophiala spinifera]
MCSHLDTLLPDTDLKLHLHQDFWRHRRNCVRCGGQVKAGGYRWQKANCVLEHLVKRTGITIKDISDDAVEPKKAATKKGVSDEAQIAKGLVKASYVIDDDFDAVTGGTGAIREVWIPDYSMVDSEMQIKEDVVECCRMCTEEEI